MHTARGEFRRLPVYCILLHCFTGTGCTADLGARAGKDMGEETPSEQGQNTENRRRTVRERSDSDATTPKRDRALRERPFVSVWTTRRATDPVFEENWVHLPLVQHGTYDFAVSWGDGTQSVISSWDAPETTHEYDDPGTYTITISGVIEGFSFASAPACGDSLDCDAPGSACLPNFEDHESLKLDRIESFGPLSLGATHGQFAGAKYLVISAKDAPNLQKTRSLARAFCATHALKITNLDRWDTSTIMDMSAAFQGSGFDQPLPWDTSSVLDMSHMFAGAFQFDQDLSDWDTSRVIDMSGMFQRATRFDADLSSWNIQSVGRDNRLALTRMFDDVMLSTEHYDALLQSWAAQDVAEDLIFDGGRSRFSATAAGARAILKDDLGWQITDAGEWE